MSSLPTNNFVSNLEGALLTLRRSWFNQGPTASPVQQTTGADGKILGTIGASDPFDDPLTYGMVTNPQSGTVEVNVDGQYTYTPGPNFTGSDSFSVRVATAEPVVDLFNPSIHGTIEVTIEVGDQGPTNPFAAGNHNNTALFLKDAEAKITVTKSMGKLIGTVLLTGVTPDTQLTWMDQHGRIGQISAADVLTHWDGINSEGNVTLGLDYTLADGTRSTVLLESVQSASDGSGQFAFTGILAPDVKDSAGVDSLYDVIGTEYKSSYETFLRTIEGVPSFSQDVTAAEFYLDTYSLSEYEDVLNPGGGLDTGQAGLGDSTVVGAPQPKPLGAATAAASPEAPLSATTLKNAVAYAQSNAFNPGATFGAGDPLFGPNGSFQPGCTATRDCAAGGQFVPMNMTLAPVSLAEVGIYTTQDGQESNVKLSYDFGAASYGYLYVPGGIWDKLNPDKWAFATMLALTTGPSVTLELVGGGEQGTVFDVRDGRVDLPPSTTGVTLQLIGGSKQGADLSIRDIHVDLAPLESDFGNVQFGGGVGANVNYTLSGDVANTARLSESVYATGGLILAYNTTAGKGIQAQANYYISSNSSRPDITGVTLNASLTPYLTAKYTYLVPAWVPIIGIAKIALFDLTLVYTNPASMKFELSDTGSPSLTAQTSGTAGVVAEILPFLKAPPYREQIPLYNVQTGNLLDY